MKKILFIIGIMVSIASTSPAAEVKANWEKNCLKCHGADGKGQTKMGQKSGVKDYTDPKVQAELKDENATKAIKEGVKEKDTDKTRMKAFPDLSEDEIKSLVAYVRSLKK